MNFTFQESSVLYGMLAESSTDIIFKTDPDGAIVHASPGMERLGHKASDAAGGEGLAPQRLLLDLVAPEARQQVAKAHARALAGDDVDWFEFPLLQRTAANAGSNCACAPCCGRTGRPMACWGSCVAWMNCAPERTPVHRDVHRCTHRPDEPRGLRLDAQAHA
ncbi:PAS domain-containing protein [Novosphingobium panipatense]